MSDLFTRTSVVKICGVTTVLDAMMVADSGADAVGLNYSTSVRRIDDDVANEVVTALDGRLECVGIFRGRSDDDVVAIVDRDGLRVAQLHDPVSTNLAAALRARGVAIIKALVAGSDDYETYDDDQCAAVLIDGVNPGSGRAVDWTKVRTREFRVPLLLAGGLNPDNVERAIATAHPWGVDVASGVEVVQARKDVDLVTRFVTRAQRAFQLERTP